MRIEKFIQQEVELRFEWGKADCCRSVDRWIELVTGVSPMDRYGRKYRTEAEARAWLAEPGSIAVAVNRGMRMAGFKKTSDPKAGDVGLIVHDDKMLMAVHAGLFWFSRDENGVIGAPLGAVWKAWKIA